MRNIIAMMSEVGMSLDVFLIALGIMVIVVIVLLVKHNKANRRISTEQYLGSTFVVNDKNVVYIGCRQEVLRGYYAQKNNSGGKR